MLEFFFRTNWERGGYRHLFYIASYPDPKQSDQLVDHLGMYDCREYLIRKYRNIITNSETSDLSVKKAYALLTYGYPEAAEFDKSNAKLQEDSQKGLYIVNSFEKAHKWPLTKLYSVKCKNIKMPLVFFAGPRKWTMSPYLLSIWTLCIRLGKNDWLPKKLLTLSHENLIRQLCISAKDSKFNDSMQLYTTIKKWDVFMDLYHKLFGGVDRKDPWSMTHLNGGNDRPEGIMKLMNGTTRYTELYKKYFELIKE